MSKYLGPKLKLCKKYGFDLNLKSGFRSIEKKCKFKNIKNISRMSDYCIQLREKQKLKLTYCILEKQFSNYYLKARKSKNDTIEYLIQMLEMRLDNIVYRIGLSKTRFEAKQLINHKLIYVNNKIINIPSYNVIVNDIITVNNKIINRNKIQTFLNILKIRQNPSWLYVDKDNISGKLLYIPYIHEINKNINGNLIIEFYSR